MTGEHGGRTHDEIEERLAQAHDLSARAREVQQQVARLHGSGANNDGSVRVQVDHHGFVEDVQVADRARELGTSGLSTAILAATQDAIADLQRQAAPLQATLAGPRTDLTDTSLLDDLDAVLRGTAGPR
jgi:DNA-binding protein YbaB